MDITHVTIIPSDRMVLVNGEGLQFDFETPADVHAIQWDNVKKTGHVEYVDCVQPNKDLTDVEYAEEVFPYVLLWQTEKNRLEAEQKAAEEAAEASRQAELEKYNSVEGRFERLRQKRDLLLTATDYYLLADYPSDPEMLEKVKAYRQALRDFTSLEGAPWDGGGYDTPWPENPLEEESTTSSEE